MSSSLDGVVARLRAAGCVFAEDEAGVLASAAASADALDAMVERRVAGEPLEYVVGWAEFCGLRVAVEPGVFVPRRRTGFMVGEAVRNAPPKPVVVDLCCGTGALGAVLGTVLEGAEVYAADVDPAAVRCARRNLPAERVFEGDLFAPLPGGLRGRVDILAANVPYVPTGEVGLLPAEARDHEARVALDGGEDGLAVLRRVAAEAGGWLAPGGRLLVETGERQAEAAVTAFERGGLAARVAASEEWHATVVVGTRR
ncbi:putative protein N(5)-glutamine methyltransferase [Actinomadura kijaniata]|uniref:peptide chain release factor N(5)-glutamine methyltransferase n=1 Tax=Actinomadura namibiensis TaxID=182080 RepID=A0A7W3LL52_ACTNM|nr:putative protein N(5)-glutamine methyltransferase [Actinomadura namibiensis]MBA8950093.1 release factor glutamine methyltransferase [Actinomadura namibiensis]